VNRDRFDGRLRPVRVLNFRYALDIIWVGLFTVVYLMGVTRLAEQMLPGVPG
jgi:hypothetical protein